MRIIFCLFILLFAGCQAPARPDKAEVSADALPVDEHIIVPGKSFGPVTLNTSEADLVRLLGASQVAPAPFYFAEGSCLPGTRIYPNDSEKSMVISWVDPGKRDLPREVRIEGEKSVWKTPQGISLGTTVRQLEVMNGKPFLFSGFSWDYEGMINNWQGGTLDGDALSGISLHLACCERVHKAYGGEELPFDAFGSDDFSSTRLAPAADLIYVDELTLHFWENARKDPEAHMDYLKPCEELEGELTIR